MLVRAVAMGETLVYVDGEVRLRGYAEGRREVSSLLHASVVTARRAAHQVRAHQEVRQIISLLFVNTYLFSHTCANIKFEGVGAILEEKIH